ncbi:MAG: cell division protein FtsZ, partial [Polyangiaceae bacterium]
RAAPPPVQEAPAPATRRPHYANEARPAAASQPPSQQRLAPRSERAVSFPSLDHDWDVPAFQRKQQ